MLPLQIACRHSLSIPCGMDVLESKEFIYNMIQMVKAMNFISMNAGSRCITLEDGRMCTKDKAFAKVSSA